MSEVEGRRSEKQTEKYFEMKRKQKGKFEKDLVLLT